MITQTTNTTHSKATPARRRNEYLDNCDKCRAEVPAGSGYLFFMKGANSTSKSYWKRVEGQWHVRCEACTLKTPSIRKELGLTGVQPAQLRNAYTKRKALQTATEELLASFPADEWGVILEEHREEYRTRLAELRKGFGK